MGKTSLNTEESIKQGSRGKGKLRTFLKRMDFVRRVWSQGIGVNFVQKEYFNTKYITGGTVFKKTILNDYKPFCNK